MNKIIQELIKYSVRYVFYFAIIYLILLAGFARYAYWFLEMVIVSKEIYQ